jgi:glycosyltransferase involved in cell wall biosynthesis
MTKLVFWLPAINPYWRDRFNALAADGEVDFECWFNRHLDPMRNWEVDPESMHFDHTFLAGSDRGGLANYVRDAWRRYRRANPDAVFTFHHEPRLWLAWLHRIRGRHLALYALLTWDSWVVRTRMKEIAKRLFFSSASSALTPGPQSDAYVQKYGARRVSRLHHAVDVEGLRAAALNRKKSDSLRLLYIGRFIEGKGLRMLMRALEPVLADHVDVTVRFVGDGPLRGAIDQWASVIGDQVEVSQFIQADKLPAVYSGADVLLFPTEGDPYGLVVDEALAAGLPVVSSNRAGDIDWRLEGDRGWVLPFDDSDAWSHKIDELARRRELLPQMSQECLRYSEGHDLDRWVDELKAWYERWVLKAGSA